MAPLFADPWSDQPCQAPTSELRRAAPPLSDRKDSTSSFASLDFSVLARHSLSPRKSSLRDRTVPPSDAGHVTAEGVAFEMHSGTVTHGDISVADRHLRASPRSPSHASSFKVKVVDAKSKPKLRTIRRTASIEGIPPAQVKSLATEAALQHLSISLPSNGCPPCDDSAQLSSIYQTPRKRSIAPVDKTTGLPTPPRSPNDGSESRAASSAMPSSPVALLSPPSSGGRARVAPRLWPSPDPDDASSSDEELISPVRLYRARQNSLTTTPNQRRRHRTASSNDRPLTPSRARTTAENVVSVGAMVDGEYKELCTVNILPVEGVTIVLRGQHGLAIESKVIHSSNETRAEIAVRSTESPPLRAVRKRVPTPSKSPLLLSSPETPRSRQLSSESTSPEEPLTPRRPSLEKLEPLIESPPFDHGRMALIIGEEQQKSNFGSQARPGSPNRFSVAFERAVSPPAMPPPSFELGGLAARRLGQGGARTMRMAVKSAFSDTESSDTTDTPGAKTVVNEPLDVFL